MAELDRDKVVATLNRLLETELAGVVRYTHYSLMVFGFGRIPIVSWLREQADESCCTPSRRASGSPPWRHPSLAIGPLLDSHKHDIAVILRESLDSERRADPLPGVAGPGRRPLGLLEEFARQMIHAEELHAAEVDKMLRKPGELAAVSRP